LGPQSNVARALTAKPSSPKARQDQIGVETISTTLSCGRRIADEAVAGVASKMIVRKALQKLLVLGSKMNLAAQHRN